ncbi:MAG: glycoside hydrolase family 16 protein [Eubacterium sp.]|nr:glycoside hydrolase family 16 protein [Eubacterium sp.]
MKRIALLIAVFTFSLGMSALVMADVPNSIDESQFKVSWSDEFDGNSLSSWWAPQRGNGNNYGVWEWGNNEKEFYKDNNISVSDGNLIINAKYEPNAGKVGDTTYNFSSGRIWSKDRIHLGYGYTEARISIPYAQGIWPAFWMLGTNGEKWPACGEIDIMEAFNTNSKLQSTIHYPGDNNKDLYNYCYENLDNKTDWHTYGCYRDGKDISFYIDRKLIGSYEIVDHDVLAYYWDSEVQRERRKVFENGKRSVLNDDYYLLINIACGGNLAGGMPGTDLNVNMYVDYVRHYVNAPDPTTQAPTKPTEKQKTTTVLSLGKAKIKSLKNIKKKRLKLSLKKIKGAQGYQVRWCDNKKFDGYEQKNVKKPKITIKGLDKKTTYWVKARAYKKANGAKVYGKWSATKKKKVKK